MGAHVHINGYLGADPELKYSPEGNARCKLRIASAGQPRNGTEQVWLNATVWGKRAEVVAEHLRSGSYVAVNGPLERRVWEDAEGGKHEVLEINSAVVDFGPKTGESDNQENEPRQRQAAQPTRQRAAAAQKPRDDDFDDLPF